VTRTLACLGLLLALAMLYAMQRQFERLSERRAVAGAERPTRSVPARARPRPSVPHGLGSPTSAGGAAPAPEGQGEDAGSGARPEEASERREDAQAKPGVPPGAVW
jgi:hypothetical protein